MIGVWGWRLSGRLGGGDFGVVGLELAFWIGLDALMNVMIPVSYSLGRWGWSLGDVEIPLCCGFECF